MARTVRISIDREGSQVVIALRDSQTGDYATIRTPLRGNGALAAQLTVAGIGDEDVEMASAIAGELETGKKKPQ